MIALGPPSSSSVEPAGLLADHLFRFAKQVEPSGLVSLSALVVDWLALVPLVC
jgi:hypothetical protein